VSAPAIVRHYRELGGSADDAEAVHRRAAAGEEAARLAFARAGRSLGQGLGLIINILNPEKIVLGGGVMSAGPLLLDPAIEEARRRSFRDAFDSCAIVPAALGNDAGFIGAALWAADTAGREP
jgi:glucokinase